VDLGLEGKSVLITGASRGIGRAIALAFAAEKARLTICARGAEALEATAAEIRAEGAQVLPLAADVTSDADRQRLVATARDAYGQIDVLVNNVGGGGGPTFLETSGAQWEEALELNVRATAVLSELVIPEMIERRSGVVLFITSVFGREWGGRPAYMTAKAAEIALAKSMARELAPFGVRVNSVAPGSVLFPGGSWDRRQKDDPERIARFVASDLPAGRFGRPEEIADVVAFLASERASWIMGACVNVDGAQSRSLF
jgi:3-oxoacyl-[acyl-carrier protein] reductase